MAATLQEQLDAANDAILKVIGGVQEYTSPTGDVVKYPALSVLMEARDALEAKVAQQSTGAVYGRVGFGRAS